MDIGDGRTAPRHVPLSAGTLEAKAELERTRTKRNDVWGSLPELRVVARAAQPEAGDFPLARIMHRLKACGLMDAVFSTFLRNTTFYVL